MLSTKQKEALGPIFPIADGIRRFFLRLKYAGNRVHCPCCGSHFKSFAPFGAVRRNNAWCPKCQSLERHRLLWLYLEKKTNLYTAPLRVLHIAPETTFFHHLAGKANIDYHPVDIYPNLYPEGTTYFNLLDPQVPWASYDVIICNHVFQYIEDDITAMRNARKLMKPGGWGIMQVPIDRSRPVTYEDKTITSEAEREKAFGLKEHVRFYGLDYADKLRNAGFTVKVDDYTAEFSDADNFKYGFWKGDAIYYCTKPD
jgi:SAM-dependent methyltransferase